MGFGMIWDLAANYSSFQREVMFRNKSAKDIKKTTTVHRNQCISALKWNCVAQPTFSQGTYVECRLFKVWFCFLFFVFFFFFCTA